MNKNFIKATEEYCKIDKHINAPYIRKSFSLDFVPETAQISICGLGFYRLFINGKDITKGFLAPYINNPDHYCYYDTYNLNGLLNQGENVIGIILGNGFLNCFGGCVWDLDKADVKGAPRLALEMIIKGEDREIVMEADESFKVHPSPITFDELRMGEHYDARLEIEGWNEPNFDDSTWQNALKAEKPRGELRECNAEPIRVQKRLKPVSISKCEDGYIYDFGENTAGLPELCIDAQPGQQITMRHGERLVDGKMDILTVGFHGEVFEHYLEYVQKTVYTAKGEGKEIYLPSFTYYGFRYIFVQGITEEQATDELFTYLVMNSDLKQIGDFVCSDETVNTLIEMVKCTDLSNFYYFLTDCPHREKNGWTGDASMSADHIALLYDVEKSWREWLHNIRKSQTPEGALPGIVPTYGWGVIDSRGSVWSGPAWDSIIFNLPYILYKYRACTDVIHENAHVMVRYLEYIMTRKDENGLVSCGLGDWCPVGKGTRPSAPRELTDSIMVMDIARKAGEMLRVIGRLNAANFADEISLEMRNSIRNNLLDKETLEMAGNCQSSQALAIYYGVYDEDEKSKAFENLLNHIHEKNDSFDSGFLGMHVIFHVLSDFGYGELAYHMITKKDFPSFAYLIECGETTMPERFLEYASDSYISHNHHFQADISRWFMTKVAGLEIIDSNNVIIKPDYLSELSHAKAYYELPAGKVSVEWFKKEECYELHTICPEEVCCNFILPDGIDTNVVYD